MVLENNQNYQIILRPFQYITTQGVWKYFSASVQTWQLKMGFTTS